MQVDATGDWQPLPTPMVIDFLTTHASSSQVAVKVAADLSRVQHSLPSTNIAFRIVLSCPWYNPDPEPACTDLAGKGCPPSTPPSPPPDGSLPPDCAAPIAPGKVGKVIAETNTGDCFGWNYAAFSFEGAMEMGSLEVGHHRAYVEFKTEKGRVFFPDSDATGNQARRMNVIAFMDHEINSKTWRDSFPAGTLNTMAVAQEDRARDCPSAWSDTVNAGYHASGLNESVVGETPPGGTCWGSLPTPMIVNFDLRDEVDDHSVVIFAGLSRVQHAEWGQNTAFRLLVNGQTVVAEHNTADAYNWKYASPFFHGVATNLGKGSHRAEVQYKTTGGQVGFWGAFASSSGNQSRQLTVHETGMGQELVSGSWSDEVEGSDTSWAPLPTRMKVDFTIGNEQGAAHIVADLSRVQHDTYGVNTAFRIIVTEIITGDIITPDMPASPPSPPPPPSTPPLPPGTAMSLATVIAETNTGSAANSDYASVSFQGQPNPNPKP